MSPKPAKRGRGRPGKLTPDRAARIIEAVRRGAYIEAAAAEVGIASSTLHGWIRRGARSWELGETPSRAERPYHEFVEALKKAQAESEAADLDRIARAADEGAWQAAAWRLERRFPDRWGRRTRVEADVRADVSARTEDAEGLGPPLDCKRLSLPQLMVFEWLCDLMRGQDSATPEAELAACLIGEQIVLDANHPSVSDEDRKTLRRIAALQCRSPKP